MFYFYSNINDDVYKFKYTPIKIGREDFIKEKLDEAFRFISNTDYELYIEIMNIVDEFFIFKTQENDGEVVYSGSDFNKLGTVFINEKTCNSDLYFLVDKIIHESAHQILLSIMIHDEIILNDDSEKYPSPLRTGLRTMNGIYHAAFVLYRIACFFNKVVISNPDDNNARIIFRKNISQFKDCYSVISEKGRLSVLGKDFIDGCNNDISLLDMKFIDSLDEKTIEIMEKFNGDSLRRLRNDLYPIAPNLVERLIRGIYQDAYQRDLLTTRERHIATLSALVAIGGAERQLSFQSYAAYKMGFTKEDLEEILIQNSIFSGFTRAMNAAVIFNETWEKFQKGNDSEA
ncbi:carboxymuconolactone decarboxylase family protein [Xenorhabdus kozodoii]|uniref:HEXXH motif domain-containing protein n=1 Tax=Xenorhabdus kozodoii TaxID=351676 RepID=A0A2D0LFP6_9GAMM|nr:carboxymuconolactone decarboxylase family protein [Xenorhabdus kozodoii]PHM74247.1 HEXXH motif domain-containing protein [Xenorhabdus kozodoii]